MRKGTVGIGVGKAVEETVGVLAGTVVETVGVLAETTVVGVAVDV
ncbi:MAG TPA: hypothetical protein VFQ36_16535 [Ktedonobacteraceae bacterium]|nr:hypothetical protein [Ktedonobacteraceae bacterium]